MYTHSWSGPGCSLGPLLLFIFFLTASFFTDDWMINNNKLKLVNWKIYEKAWLDKGSLSKNEHFNDM